MTTLDGIAPVLATRFLALQAAAAQAGHSIGITSGFRTPEEQARLRKKNRCRDVWSAPASSCRVPTAVPYRSKHNHGLAIDFSGNAAAKAWVAANAANFGLGLPVDGEDWHLEPAGDAASMGLHQAAEQMGAIGYDLNWAEEERDPMDVVDERISGMLDVIAGEQNAALALGAVADPSGGSPGDPSGADPSGLAMGQLREDVTTVPGTPMSFDTQVMGAGAQWDGGVPPPGYVPPGKGVERWRPVALAALQYTGQDPKWVDLMLQRMEQESGGNPTIVNDWDINAQRGDPSIGLMQNIGSAFPERAKELTPRGITDGFANMVASIRYTLGRYGSLSAWSKPGGY